MREGMFKFLQIIAILGLVSGCSGDSIMGGSFMGRDYHGYADGVEAGDAAVGFGSYMSPRPFMMRNIPGGSDAYSVGFRDGCETTTGLGSGLNRMHDMGYDVDRGLKDKHYYAGYRAGHVYCLFYTDVDPL